MLLPTPALTVMDCNSRLVNHPSSLSIISSQIWRKIRSSVQCGHHFQVDVLSNVSQTTSSFSIHSNHQFYTLVLIVNRRIAPAKPVSNTSPEPNSGKDGLQQQRRQVAAGGADSKPGSKPTEG